MLVVHEGLSENDVFNPGPCWLWSHTQRRTPLSRLIRSQYYSRCYRTQSLIQITNETLTFMHIYKMYWQDCVVFKWHLLPLPDARSAHWTVLSLDYSLPPEQVLSLLPCCNSDEWRVRNSYHLDLFGIPLMPGWRDKQGIHSPINFNRPMAGAVNRMD